jgi:hypothetical protein
MKKLIASLLMMSFLAIALPLTADAQRRCSCSPRRSYSSRNYRSYRNRSYVNRSYQTRGYTYQQPSFYRRHRNLINLGLATGGGAFIGALLGGKKGALLGTAIGAGSGALYTYGINKKRRRY